MQDSDIKSVVARGIGQWAVLKYNGKINKLAESIGYKPNLLYQYTTGNIGAGLKLLHKLVLDGCDLNKLFLGELSKEDLKNFEDEKEFSMLSTSINELNSTVKELEERVKQLEEANY